MQESDHKLKNECALALGELIDTAERLMSSVLLPHFAAAVASRSFLVLLDPTHFLYAKINGFLNKGASWSLERLPAYWMDQILLQQPSEDNAAHKEIGWLIDALYEGLQSLIVSIRMRAQTQRKTDFRRRILRSIEGVTYSSVFSL